jgi:uncharacterized protein YkwD
MRTSSLSAVLVLAMLAVAPSLAQAAQKTSFSGASESRVLVLLNDIREQHGLTTLRPSVALRGAAREHSADMLARGYFDHDGPRESFGKRIRRHLRSPLVGENIAWGTGRYGTPEGLVKLWMNSPGHRRIILMPGLHRIGLGVATGSFKGIPGAVMATADFSS